MIMSIKSIILITLMCSLSPIVASAANSCDQLFEARVIDYSQNNSPGKGAVYGSADETFAEKLNLLRGAQQSILISTFSI